jgi:hypothetical protein
MCERGPVVHTVHELVSQYSQLSAHSLQTIHQTTATQDTGESHPAPTTPPAPSIATSELMTIQSGPKTPVRIGNNLRTFSIQTSSSACKKIVTASEWVGCLCRKMAPIVDQSPACCSLNGHIPLLLPPFLCTRGGRSGCLEPPKIRRPKDFSLLCQIRRYLMDPAIHPQEGRLLQYPSKFQHPVCGRCRDHVPGVMHTTTISHLHQGS